MRTLNRLCSALKLKEASPDPFLLTEQAELPQSVLKCSNWPSVNAELEYNSPEPFSGFRTLNLILIQSVAAGVAVYIFVGGGDGGGGGVKSYGWGCVSECEVGGVNIGCAPCSCN